MNSSDLFQESYEEIDNPLDTLEGVLKAQDWHFDRKDEDELRVRVKGKYCAYNLFFIWEGDMRAVQFCAQYDLTIPEDNMKNAASTLLTVNEKLWMGHFDIMSDTLTPTFRYTSLISGEAQNTATEEHLQEIINIAMTQCERFFSIFHLLSQKDSANDDTLPLDLPLALMETQGVS